jgi:FAD synthetase
MERLSYRKIVVEDAKYYFDRNRFEVVLASVAYCEGILDALRLLETVEFTWPPKMREERVQGEKRKVVLASGTFDLLHFGHVKFLEEAKKAGGENAKLVVVVARDSTVEKRKGRKPIMPEDQRRALVEALKVVDEALLGYKDFSIEKVVEKIKPNIIAIGHDQDGIERAVKNYIEEKSLNIEIVKIGKFGKEELNSSSKIMRKIIESYKG